MSMLYTAPVPKDNDTKQDYGNRPIASGPYKIESTTVARRWHWCVTRIGIPQPIPIGPHIPTASSSN